MNDYPCCECCLTDTMHPDHHDIPCPTCNNPTADRLRAEVERLTTVVRRVRELHRESHGSLSALYPNPICECGKDYPCPTIRALDGVD